MASMQSSTLATTGGNSGPGLVSRIVAHLLEHRKAVLLCAGVGLVWAVYTRYLEAKIIASLGLTATTEVGLEYDFVIVGGGSAGSALANRLSADGMHSVLLLEAGPSMVQHPLIRCPLYHTAVWGSGMEWELSTTKQARLMGRSLLLHRMKALGGQAVNNDTLYVRGSRHDFASWGEAGLEWSYDSLLPYYRETQKRHAPAGATPSLSQQYHGTAGELEVSNVADPGGPALAFVQACAEVGLRGSGGSELIGDDYNAEELLGAGLAQCTITAGAERSYAAPAFLCPAFTRSNLTIKSGAHATRVVVEDKAAQGVAFVDYPDGPERVVKARKEVVLSCGPIGSPQVLMLSGIGPKAHLEEVGIPVVQDLPVGDNLQDQVGVNLTYECKSTGDSLDTLLSSTSLTMAAGMTYEWLRSGAMANPIVQAVAFGKEKEETAGADLQYNFFPVTVDLLCADRYAEAERPGETFFGVTLAPILLHPKSTGTVRLKSSNPMDQPVVDPRYLEEEEDMELLVAGVRKARAIMRTELMASGIAGEWRCPEEALTAPTPAAAADGTPATEVTADEEEKSADKEEVEEKEAEEELEQHLEDGPVAVKAAKEGLSEEEYVRRYIAKRLYSTSVPVGTCKMAEDASGVVDLRLRVKGISRLRVVDSSVIPSCMSGSSTVTAIAIAARAATLIKEDHML